jgi:hypothetical protein
VTRKPSPVLQILTRDAKTAARGIMLRGLSIGLALLGAIIGVGFLLLAGFDWLRWLMGPVFAALSMGAGLLFVSVCLLWATVRSPPPSKVAAPITVASIPVAASDARTDTMAMTAFTVAFVIGRFLSARKRD